MHGVGKENPRNLEIKKGSHPYRLCGYVTVEPRLPSVWVLQGRRRQATVSWPAQRSKFAMSKLSVPRMVGQYWPGHQVNGESYWVSCRLPLVAPLRLGTKSTYVLLICQEAIYVKKHWKNSSKPVEKSVRRCNVQLGAPENCLLRGPHHLPS